MGIEDINVVIKSKSPAAVTTIPITYMSNKRVAIDTSLWMRANMYTARKIVVNRLDPILMNLSSIEIRNEWLSLGLEFVFKWLSYNIIPVFVLDGAPLPEKEAVLQSRRTKEQDTLSKLVGMEHTLRNISHNQNGTSENDTLSNSTVNIPEYLKNFKNEYPRYTRVSDEDYNSFIKLMRGLGVPCIQAKNEAEELCSMLCREGKVAAVYSRDTDNLAYGCPVMITGFTKSKVVDQVGNKVHGLEIVRTDKILENLNMSYTEFVDFCIMCGCDYNKRLTTVTNAYTLISTYRSIDRLPKNYDINSFLNYVRCREIFTYKPSESLVSIENSDNTYKSPESLVSFENVVGTYKPSESLVSIENSNDTYNIKIEKLDSAKQYLDSVGLGSKLAKLIHAYYNISGSYEGHMEILNIIPVEDFSPKRRLILNIVSQ